MWSPLIEFLLNVFRIFLCKLFCGVLSLCAALRASLNDRLLELCQRQSEQQLIAELKELIQHSNDITEFVSNLMIISNQ